MEQIKTWANATLEGLQETFQNILLFLPKLIGAILIIIIGWIIAKVVRSIVRRIFKGIKFNEILDKTGISAFLQKIKISQSGSDLLGTFAYWFILLIFFMTATDYLNLEIVSNSIKDLINYLPQLFSAMVIFLIGYYIAGFIKKGLSGILEGLGINGGKLVSIAAYYIILFLVTLTALSQAGIDISIITNNVSIVVAGILLAFAIGFGLSSPDILKNMLSSYYSKHQFVVGQKIKVNGKEGVIEKLGSVSFVLKTTEGKTVLPTRLLVSESIDIIE